MEAWSDNSSDWANAPLSGGGPEYACIVTGVLIFIVWMTLACGKPELRARVLGGDGDLHFRDLRVANVTLDARKWGPLRFGLFRLFCGIFALGSMAIRVFVWGHPQTLQTFTFWNWTMLGVYFTVTGFMSLCGPDAQAADSPANAVQKFLWVWCQIMTVCALFIFLIVWVVLIPVEMLINGWEDLPDGSPATRGKFFNWISFAAHNANVIFCFVEVYLNRMTFLRAHASFIVLWGNAYIFFAWYNYWATDKWWYIFLDWDILGYFTPVAYVGLVGVLYATFLWVAGFSLRAKAGMTKDELPTAEGTPEDSSSSEIPLAGVS